MAPEIAGCASHVSKLLMEESKINWGSVDVGTCDAPLVKHTIQGLVLSRDKNATKSYRSLRTSSGGVGSKSSRRKRSGSRRSVALGKRSFGRSLAIQTQFRLWYPFWEFGRNTERETESILGGQAY